MNTLTAVALAAPLLAAVPHLARRARRALPHLARLARRIRRYAR